MLVALICVSGAMAEGDAKAGKEHSFTCMGCHGQKGMRNAYPGYHVPRLGGQNEEYIEIALKAYRSGERSHPTMHGHATSLSDQAIADIATYFASLQND